MIDGKQVTLIICFPYLETTTDNEFSTYSQLCEKYNILSCLKRFEHDAVTIDEVLGGSKRYMNKGLLEKIKFQLEGHREVILSSSITLAEGRALGHDLRGDGLCGLRGTIQKARHLRRTEGYGTG